MEIRYKKNTGLLSGGEMFNNGTEIIGIGQLGLYFFAAENEKTGIIMAKAEISKRPLYGWYSYGIN